MSHCDDLATPPHCPEELLLLDHVLGRAAPEARTRLDAHIAACARCREAAEKLGEETGRLLRLLEQAPVSGDEPHQDTRTLADYLDGALDSQARTACETHLAACRPCQEILIRLHRDVEAAWDPVTPLPVVEHRSAGEHIDWEQARTQRQIPGQSESNAGLEKSKDQNDKEGSDAEARRRRELS